MRRKRVMECRVASHEVNAGGRVLRNPPQFLPKKIDKDVDDEEDIGAEEVRRCLPSSVCLLAFSRQSKTSRRNCCC